MRKIFFIWIDDLSAQKVYRFVSERLEVFSDEFPFKLHEQYLSGKGKAFVGVEFLGESEKEFHSFVGLVAKALNYPGFIIYFKPGKGYCTFEFSSSDEDVVGRVKEKAAEMHSAMGSDLKGFAFKEDGKVVVNGYCKPADKHYWETFATDCQFESVLFEERSFSVFTL